MSDKTENFNAADETAVRRREIEAENTARQQDEDLARILETPGGRRFLRRVLDCCGIFRLSFDPTNARLTDFHEGARNVGQWLWAEMERVDLKHALQCLREE